ncbi:hypothetical protein GQ43DRAFT_114653 [Delitschia confertaspora ATCC 74209]|uniref:Uncharacterized protein n=1 Tax=Delitschia confertaspora ATCC 74209 TaxID=1513339 RepID=A0A9P4JHU1_9PLEO|nr:hypothetical protein GQ43DRAFT_114653 [Delitschia confertaspora ATCC 74209]
MSTTQNPSPFARPGFSNVQSSASTTSTASAFQTHSSTSSFSSPSSESAPLPSPSTSYQNTSFFGSLAHQQQQNAQTQPQSTNDYRPSRDSTGRTTTETNAYLNDFALLAEAAKRAQMACLMRDMEGVEL